MAIRALVATAALVASVTTAAGCSASDDEATRPGDATTTAAETTTTVAEVAEPTLLDPGAEPRQALRFALTPGTETTLAITTDLAIAQTAADGRRQRLDSPPITQWITYTVGDVADGEAQVGIEVVAAFARGEGTGLDPTVVAEIDADLSAIVGTTGTAVVTDRGRFTDVSFDTDDLDGAVAEQIDALAANLGAFAPPLPVDAVGVGARWEATVATAAGGVVLTATTTYTVTAIDDDAVTYEAESTIGAEPQDLDGAALPEGTTARLLAATGSGTATGTQHLDDLRLELTVRSESVQELEVTDEQGSRRLTQEVTTATSARTPDP